MSEKDTPDSLRDLDDRLRRFREKTREPEDRDETAPRGAMAGFGIAMRIGTEMVAALIVGVAIGFGLDKWLGTTPWFLVVFFFLGASAGIMNVYRTASGLGASPLDGRTKRTNSTGSGGADDDNNV